LFRALLGLVVGFLIGLMFATYVVQWIQTPLTRALRDYYLQSATADLDAKFQGDPPPEMRTLIEEDRLVPESVLVEPFGFLRKLHSDYPDQFAQVPVVTGQFVAEDLSMRKVRGLCAALVKGSQDDDSALAEVWKALSDEQRDEITSLSTRRTVGPVERQAIIRVLNALVQRRTLHEGATFETLKKAVSDDSTRQFVAGMQSELDRQYDESQSRRLNRLLLASVLDDYLRRPRFNLVELVTWKPVDVEVQSLSAHEGFMIWIKAALITGAVISSPWIFLQVWEFVAAGLYPHEKRFVHVFLPFSLLLFFAGASLAFFFVFKPVLDFLFSFNQRMDIDAAPRISEWLSFVLFLPLGFGISFQLPLVMLFLERIGIFTISSYLSKWRIAILVIFVLAMLLTPADPVSMLLMAVPLTVLYFGGIVLCRWIPRRSSPLGDGHQR
jgi:sec-independent protein translocase protein TatC